MKWLFLLIPAVVAAAVIARRKGSGWFRSRADDPEDARRRSARWAYENITAVRKNTERIIELLEAVK